MKQENEELYRILNDFHRGLRSLKFKEYDFPNTFTIKSPLIFECVTRNIKFKIQGKVIIETDYGEITITK